MHSDNPPITAAIATRTLRDRKVGDALFAIQIFSAIGFGIAQGLLMMKTTEGVSLTWLSFWGVFLLINLSLSFRAHQLQPSRVTWQTMIAYATWTVMMLFDTGIYLWQATVVWTAVDTWTMVIALAGIVITVTLGLRNNLAITDPLVRGYLAVFFKGVPQLTLAWNILMVGGGGGLDLCHTYRTYHYLQPSWPNSDVATRSALGP